MSLNSNVKYDVSIDGEWITEASSQTKTRSLSTSTHTFVVGELANNVERNGSITFKNEKTNTNETITVIQKPSLYFSSSTLELAEEATEQLSYTNNLENNGVTFSSSNPEVATVSEDGTVKAVSRGNATITITSADGKHSDKCEVTVKNIVDYQVCYCYGGSIILLNGLLLNGSQLSCGLINKSDSEIIFKSMQLVDGVTGRAGNEVKVNENLPAGQGVSYTLTIGLAGIHIPVTCRFKIEYNNKTYTVEAVYKD